MGRQRDSRRKRKPALPIDQPAQLCHSKRLLFLSEQPPTQWPQEQDRTLYWIEPQIKLALLQKEMENDLYWPFEFGEFKFQKFISTANNLQSTPIYLTNLDRNEWTYTIAKLSLGREVFYC